jgi:heme-degrading monooxygenase HmoA
MLVDFEDGKITAEEEKEIEYYLSRMKENMSKMKGYLTQNVDEIKE